MSHLTPFQLRCRESLASLLSKYGEMPRFEEVRCERAAAGVDAGTEYYLRTQTQLGGRDLECFVYVDEAGLFCDGSWEVFERQDFDEEDSLIAAFVKRLEVCVSSNASASSQA